MTTYKGIRGQTIRTIAGDASTLIAGDIWYNSTLKKIRGTKLVAAWATGGALNTVRTQIMGTGTQTAAIVFSGRPPEANHKICETYDGTSWTEVADTSTQRGRCGAAGVSNTAALCIGGLDGTVSPAIKTNVEKWDGSSWTEVGDINTARMHSGCFGTNTSAIAAAGDTYPSSPSNVVESWDDSSWTETTEVNTSRGEGSGGSAGTVSTAGLIFGGNPNVVEEWDGSSWTETGDLNTLRTGGAGAGISTAALYMGAISPTPAKGFTEEWDGSSWSEIADLATAHGDHAGTGTATSALVAGGGPGPGKLNTTEEFTKAVTASSFTSS